MTNSAVLAEGSFLDCKEDLAEAVRCHGTRKRSLEEIDHHGAAGAP